MTDRTNKYERHGITGALISNDVSALNARKREIENQRKMKGMERKIADMETKLDAILTAIQNIRP